MCALFMPAADDSHAAGAGGGSAHTRVGSCLGGPSIFRTTLAKKSNWDIWSRSTIQQELPRDRDKVTGKN
jgi:hypothetical protein